MSYMAYIVSGQAGFVSYTGFQKKELLKLSLLAPGKIFMKRHFELSAKKGPKIMAF